VSSPSIHRGLENNLHCTERRLNRFRLFAKTNADNLNIAHNPSLSMSQHSKLFGIGLSRTGTWSLTAALRILGYSAVHCPSSFEQIVANEAATDTPIALAYKALDLFFPNSKFILTDRNLDDWLASCERFFLNSPKPRGSYFYKIRTALYGTADFDVVAFSEAHKRHLSDVRAHFSTRPEDLLVMRICDGDGWDTLCSFLEKPHPPITFPHRNKSKRN